MRNVTECQQRLIQFGYLSPTYIEDGVTKTNADGKFGSVSLDAYNHWRASKGAGPVHAAGMSQLNRDLFPEEQPNAKPALTPNPLVQAIGLFALKLALQRLTKGTISMNVLAGYKTYIVGVMSILIGVLDWVGIAIPDTSNPSPAAWIVAGLVACFGRAGLAKVVEDVISGLGPK